MIPARSRCAIRAAKASASRCPSTASRCRSARAACCARAPRIALLSLGTRLAEALKAAEDLEARGLSTTVADARFAKPLDRELILKLADNHEVLLTIEEGAVGGFGAHVLSLLAESGRLDRGLKVRTLTLPDRYQDHDKPERLYAASRARRGRRSSPRALQALGPTAKVGSLRA